MIGIITATIQELNALNKVLGTTAKGPMEFVTGVFGKTEVVGVQAGIGKVNAAMCAQKMIDVYHPEKIIMVGVAGALAKDLHVGDVIISRDCCQHDFDTTFFGDPVGYVTGFADVNFKADEELCEKALTAAKEAAITARLGRVASGDQFIASEEKKKTIIENMQADCTEMEGAAIAQVCEANQVPFVVIRAISDGAGDDAPMMYDEFVNFAAERAMKIIGGMLK